MEICDELSSIVFLLPQIRSYKNVAFVFYPEYYSTSPVYQENRKTFTLGNEGEKK